MEKIEVVVENNNQSALNLLMEETLEEDQKMWEDLDFFLGNNASQKKSSTWQKKLSLTARQGSRQGVFWQTFLITA